MTSLKGLQRVLRKRLPEIDRWKCVSVLKHDSPRISHNHKPFTSNGYYYIRWYGPKRGNIHPEEYYEFPCSELEAVVRRKRNRLRNKTKTYR